MFPLAGSLLQLFRACRLKSHLCGKMPLAWMVLFFAACAYGQLCGQATLSLEVALANNCDTVKALVISNFSSLENIMLPIMTSLIVQSSNLRNFSGVVFRQAQIPGAVIISANPHLTSCLGT